MHIELTAVPFGLCLAQAADPERRSNAALRSR